MMISCPIYWAGGADGANIMKDITGIPTLILHLHRLIYVIK